MSQHRFDSAMETVTNTLIGYVIAWITTYLVAWLYHIPAMTHNAGSITGIFTIISLIRQYSLRRLFNGRSIWQTLRGKYHAARSRDD